MAEVREKHANSGGSTLAQDAEGYLVALIGVLLCTIVRYPLQSILETRAPYAFYIPIVAFCAWRYGLKSAVACFMMGAAVGTYLYVRPFYAITHRPEAISLFIFLTSCFAVALIGGANKRAHDQLAHAREELRQANQELERRVEDRTAALVEKNEELSSFTYTVAHDLRSAIRSMVVNARVLMEDEGDRLGESGCDQTQKLHDAAIRLSTFVDDLLQYARTGNRPISSDIVDLSRIFERQSDVVGAEVQCEDFDTRVQHETFVNADPTLMALVMHNLVENACKYRSPDRRLLVEFGTIELDGEDWFYVRDNGIGFDPGFAQRIFKPFERLHRYADIPGTGIGLSNVKRIIERHGGKIWAESPGSQKGATFYFTLQRVARPAKTIAGEAAIAA
jgi:signal transduction histidine kinase